MALFCPLVNTGEKKNLLTKIHSRLGPLYIRYYGDVIASIWQVKKQA